MAEKNNSKSILTNAIVVCVIIGASIVVHSVLGGVGVSGNLVWLIINALFVALNVLNGLYALKFIVLPLKNDKENMAAFITGLVGMIVSFVFSFWWAVDLFINLSGVIQGNL